MSLVTLIHESYTEQKEAEASQYRDTASGIDLTNNALLQESDMLKTVHSGVHCGICRDFSFLNSSFICYS